MAGAREASASASALAMPPTLIDSTARAAMSFAADNASGAVPRAVDGTLTIIQEDSPDSYSVCQTVTTQRGCRTITLDEKTGRVVTCAPKFGPVPAAVKGGPRPRAPVLPGTFEAIVIGLK